MQQAMEEAVAYQGPVRLAEAIKHSRVMHAGSSMGPCDGSTLL
jgi:hypothetical protein